MNIKELLRDKGVLEGALSASKRMRMLSDVNGVGGAMFEIAICKSFNNNSSDYKLFTMRLIENLVQDPNYTFSFSPKASSFSELREKSKEDRGWLSAADIYLFRKQGSHYFLVDAASLKSSIDPKNPTPVYIHNDASNFIHESLRDRTNLDSVIGNVVIVMLRGNDYKVYYFDKKLSLFDNKMKLICSNKHGDREYGFGDRKMIHSKNRNAATHKKQTSFNRGLLLLSKRTRKEGEFDRAEELVAAGVFERGISGSTSTAKMLDSLAEEMRL